MDGSDHWRRYATEWLSYRVQMRAAEEHAAQILRLLGHSSPSPHAVACLARNLVLKLRNGVRPVGAEE